MKDKDVRMTLKEDVIKHKEDHEESGRVLLSDLIASPLGRANKQPASEKHHLITDLLAEGRVAGPAVCKEVSAVGGGSGGKGRKKIGVIGFQMEQG